MNLSKGHAEQSLPGDNPAALLIILHLIHGQIRKVPRRVDLWMLTELAILVDKYELLESVEMALDHWLQNLESTTPRTLNNDLLSWMCISWLFQKPELFKKITKIAQLESEGHLEANQLPIPESVLSKHLLHANGVKLNLTDTIDQDRQNTLTEIFGYLQGVLERYKSGERICSQGIQCDAMILGSLTIGLNAINILQPPSPTYDGFSVKDVSEKLREMRIPQFCLINSRSYYSDRPCEGIEEPLEAKLKQLEQRLQGIDLYS